MWKHFQKKKNYVITTIILLKLKNILLVNYGSSYVCLEFVSHENTIKKYK